MSMPKPEENSFPRTYRQKVERELEIYEYENFRHNAVMLHDDTLQWNGSKSLLNHDMRICNQINKLKC